MKSKILIMLGVLVTMGIQTLFAQPEGKRREQLESLRIAYFTKQIQLTPAEAKLFWPLYNEYKAEEMRLRKQNPLGHRSNIDATLEDLNDARAQKLLTEMITHEQKLLDLQVRYLDEFKKVLSDPKRVRLLYAERNFKKELLRHIGHPETGP